MSKVIAATLAPDTVELKEFERPEVGAADLLVEIQAVGICGSDKHMYLGHAKLDFPIIPGHEMVGKVIAMGDHVAVESNVIGGPISVGDRVAVTPSTHGCGRCWFCQHVPHKPPLCPNRMVYGFTPVSKPPHLYGAFSQVMFVGPKSNIFRIPDALSTERAVLTEPAAVATRAVERAMGSGIPHVGEGLSIGKRVAVLGAGPIGLLTVAALRHVGAGLVIVTDLSERRLKLAERLGADVTVNLKETSPEDRLEAVRDVTDGVGPDVVIESAGVPAAFEEGLMMVRRGGRLIEVGHYFDSGTVSISPHTFCFKEVDVHGVFAYPFMQFETALSLLKRSSAPFEELLTATMPLADLEKGIHMTGDEQAVKIVVQPDR
jgi:L-iditol 2-dehydrogenase